MIPAVIIFLATYLVMAIGHVPGYRIDRAGAALLGACLMVAAGVLTLHEAFAAIDLETIAPLLGMMIVVANLRLSGFFRQVTAWIVAQARSPLVLLAGLVAATGVLSAFLVNDAVCLVMTPLVLDVVLRFRRDPVPYMLAVAMASNAGSVATITGNPQNMIIGSLSGIPYGRFFLELAPVALAALLLVFVLVVLFHPREFFRSGKLMADAALPVTVHTALAAKSVATLVVMVALFFLGFPVAGVAILGGALLLFTRRVKPAKVYREVDWPLLVMFGGLFVVVAGLEKAVLDPDTVAAISRIDLNSIPVLAAVTAVLSNLVSNVPAVLVLKPFIAGLVDPERAWLAVAMAATLAGNFTLVGSVANLIVAERALARGVTVGFWPYFKVGSLLTILSVIVGIFWLGWL